MPGKGYPLIVGLHDALLEPYIKSQGEGKRDEIMKHYRASGIFPVTAFQACERLGIKTLPPEPSPEDPCTGCIFLSASRGLRKVVGFLRNMLFQGLRRGS